MQQHLVEHAAQHVAGVGRGGGALHRLTDGAAQRAGGVRELGQDLPPHLGGQGGGGRHVRAVGAHDLPAEGLLLIGALHHEHMAVQPQIGAGHAQRRAPLAGTGLRGHAGEPLLLGVVGLGDGGVQLVAAGGVVALELVVDMRRGAQLLLQTIGAHQRGGTVHLIEVPHVLRNGDQGSVVVYLLLYQLGAEHLTHLLRRHGLKGAGVQQGSGLRLHVGAYIVPIPGHLVLGEIDLVGNVAVFQLFHGCFLLSVSVSARRCFMQNSRSAWRASPWPASRRRRPAPPPCPAAARPSRSRDPSPAPCAGCG